MSSELHRAALEYAARGIPVFPLVAGTKEPTEGSHGFHDATTDPARIDAWWAEDQNYNIGFSPHTVGLGVVDLDGAAGEDAWLDLQIEHGSAPDTFTVATPRNGGRHLYFNGELRPTQSTLGPHVDTRGRGSYALLPPSRLAGWPEPYKVVNNAPYADVPAWVYSRLADAEKAKVRAADVPLDLPGNIARAASLLRSRVAAGKVATEGEMGDGETYKVACELLNLGLSEERALALLESDWNPHCNPPWEPEDLANKVHNAASYAQNEAGAWATAPAADVFGPALDKLGLTSETPQERSFRFRGYTVAEMRSRPEPTWLLPDFMAEQGLGLIYGPPGGYKTFLALHKALEVAATGRPVLWIAGEGAPDVGPRVSAWALAHDMDPDTLPFITFDEMPWASDGAMLAEFIADAKAQGFKADLIVLDTVATAMIGMNENDAKDAGLFIGAMKVFRKAFGSAVLAIHHTGKDDARGTRGSNAIPAGVDSAFEVKANTDTKAVAIYCRRQRSVAKRETPWYYEGRPLAGTLAFFPIERAAFNTLTAGNDDLAPRVIGGALAKLQAHGEDAAVMTHVLASELVPHDPAETEESRQEAVSRTARALKSRADKGLAGYAKQRGREWLWSLPSGDEP